MLVTVKMGFASQLNQRGISSLNGEAEFQARLRHCQVGNSLCPADEAVNYESADTKMAHRLVSTPNEEHSPGAASNEQVKDQSLLMKHIDNISWLDEAASWLLICILSIQ